MNDQNIMFGYTSPIENLEKSKNVKQLVLMNAHDIFIYPFYSGNIIYLTKILRALFSNKNEILHY